VTTKTRFAVHWASSRVLWTALYSVPRIKKVRDVATLPPPPFYTPKVAQFWHVGSCVRPN